MKIDISKKVTYFKALLMPFHVTPLITALSIVDSLLKLGLVPLGVLATHHCLPYKTGARKAVPLLFYGCR